MSFKLGLSMPSSGRRIFIKVFFQGFSIFFACFFCGVLNGQPLYEEIPDFEVSKNQPERIERSVPSTFFEQFIFGMITFESGTAKMLSSDGVEIVSQIPLGSMIKTGSVIETPQGFPAQVRLGCGSTVRLAPDTRVQVLPFAIELQKGSCLAKHIAEYFPLKIQGASTLLVSKDSVVSVERVGDKNLAEVLVGKLRTPGFDSPVLAGQSIEASGRKAKLLKAPQEPRAWDPPSQVGNQDFQNASETPPTVSSSAAVAALNDQTNQDPQKDVLDSAAENYSPEAGSDSSASFLGKDEQ